MKLGNSGLDDYICLRVSAYETNYKSKIADHPNKIWLITAEAIIAGIATVAKEQSYPKIPELVNSLVPRIIRGL